MDDLTYFLEVIYGDQTGFVYAPVRYVNGKWLQKFFGWPAQKDDLRGWIELAKIEADVFVAPAMFREKKATKEFAIGAQVCWVEFDGQTEINLSGLPTPTLQVCTSLETHLHVYWKTPQSTAAVIEGLNRRLTYHLGADSSGWDINQVLRPPGTFNWKRNLPVRLKNAGAVGQPVVAHDLQKFDFIVEPPPIVPITDLSTIPEPYDVLVAHKLPMKVWNLIKQTEVPFQTRSTHLMHIGHSLAEVGLQQDEIVSLLLIADDRIEKFVGRSDRLTRLSEIASKALLKQVASTTIPTYSWTEILEAEFEFNSHWGDFLPMGGNLILAGAPSVGKSQLSLQAAEQFALNKSLLNWETKCEGQVLYFSFEMPGKGLKRFISQHAALYTKEQKEILHRRCHIAFVPSSTLDEVEKKIEEVGPNICFFDSLSSLSVDEMSSEKEAKRLTDWDRHIRDEYDCASWFVHHNRKASSDNKAPNKLSDLYGSYLYAAKFDTILMLYHAQNAKKHTLFPVKTRYGREEAFEVSRTANLLFERTQNATNDGSQSGSVGSTKPGDSMFNFGLS